MTLPDFYNNQSLWKAFSYSSENTNFTTVHSQVTLGGFSMEFEQKLLSSVFSRCWAQNAIYQHLYICITLLQGHMKSFLKKHFKSNGA